MERVYYVQRLKKSLGAINPFAFGGSKINGGFNPEAFKIISTIMDFDYMGSAEFEWGAVPTAFKVLFSLPSTSAFEVEGFPKPVYLICPTPIKEDVINWLKEASYNTPRLKERLGFKEALLDRPHNDYAGWIKIEDDDRCKEPFMFFINKEMFDNVCKLM